jgi:hypothetical protein
LGSSFSRRAASDGCRRGNSCSQIRNECAAIAGDTVDRAQQLAHARDQRQLRLLTGRNQALIVRSQPWIDRTANIVGIQSA